MKVGIIGSGTMGSGIAQVAATDGCGVKLFDTNNTALDKAKTSLEKILARLVEKGKINSEEKSRIQNNISYVNNLKDLSDSDLTIEAIVENLEIKKKVFSELETYVSDDCIIASNTSSLSIASIASALQKPERCIGIHFFNPAPLMALVEVIPAIQTSKEVLEKSVQTISDWKKTVAVAKDTPGFIVNRVARPFYGESLRIYEEGIADFATIDHSLKTLGGFRMGPFELMDFIGNDVNYTVTETVFAAFYFDPRYKPSFTQKRFSEAGYLGRKSGKGYYDYSEGAIQPTPKEDKELAQQIFDRVLIMLINEAADALFLNIASAKDIDNAMTKGVNYPKGLLAWADEKGIDWCVSKMDELYNEYHEDRYRCSPLLRKMKAENKIFF
ncbi:3-hydroxyacyl-CoA dehydrogenase NAD-binding domain-containing protein [Subsaxibacter sp. CAU 1640]|uniref:3-hydroxyacyl-CoA dehydrogenase NAD-binding domain-containing protein n=1 Tax=Subsaxibacter sp. CAU 1640 TaxID=2933271 RepID=UPI002002A3CB|nr:3-hydroxyacyl-CoA dehydrogenase NAD-binding domain-containing protein [Subsaxibacter sp. CAU 1640]MCK7590291.1 3-hydroxyacyl-CoA dehydrogenase NAD-binding domain-containing protein [Subsaxibacter sp. CAU 1640]